MNAFEKGRQQGIADRARGIVNRAAYYGDYFSIIEGDRKFSSGYRRGWHGLNSKAVHEYAA